MVIIQDCAANILQHDPVLQAFSNDELFASQSSISRFYDRVVGETIDTPQVVNQALIDKARLLRNDTNMIIDLDSTHSDTFGDQEHTAYNAHYGTNGYHPLVAFDGITSDFLKLNFVQGTNILLKGSNNFLNR